MKDKPKREMSPQFLAIKRQYASCFIILFASFLIGLAVRTILCMPLIAILTEVLMLNKGTATFIDSVTGFAVALVTIFILSFNDGYHKNKFVFKQLLLAIVLTFIMQVVINLILGPSVWFSGPTVFISDYVFKHTHFEILGTMGAKQISKNYDWLFMMLSFWFAYAPLIITGKYLGAKKSKRDFAKVKGERKKQKSFDEHPLDL